MVNSTTYVFESEAAMQETLLSMKGFAIAISQVYNKNVIVGIHKSELYDNALVLAVAASDPKKLKIVADGIRKVCRLAPMIESFETK